jgi:RNA polymerase sigma-70 factor (ECF subfamily)
VRAAGHRVIILASLGIDQGKGKRRVDGSVDLAELLERTSAGDRMAFAELYRATSPKLFAIGLRMLRASDLAEDALQSAYLLIWRKADRFRREEGNPMAWMAAIVRHSAIDVLRRRSHESPLADADAVAFEAEAATEEDADARWAAISAGDRLRRCLGELQEQERHCILLAYYEGKSHGEIASTIGRPLGSVKSWLRRGLLKLKDCVEG